MQEQPPSAEQARQLMHKPALPIPQPPLNTVREAGAYLGLFVFFWMGGLVKLL